MRNILDFTLEELTAAFKDLGEPAFRARQVFQWLWQKGARDFAAMTSLSKALRQTLAEEFAIPWPEVLEVRESSDGTKKLLLGLEDGARVETVLIPEKDHVTQCLSTQVGCALGCAFCATGTMGLTRNLTHAELCGQVLAGRAVLGPEGDRLRNLVFMGMGEPLMNLENLTRALTTLGHDSQDLGLGISSRRITVSTAGIPGKIAEFGETGLASLAVSLHAPTQELRERLMPKAAKMLPLPQLMAELRRYPLKNRDRITFEYILIGGVNDSVAHARELVRLLSHVKGKVNLIVYNPTPGSQFQAPTAEAVADFAITLHDKGFTVITRKSKGQDIAAACGQLVVESRG